MPKTLQDGGFIRELYWAIKTKRYAPTMNLLEYFCWRIVRQRKLPR